MPALTREGPTYPSATRVRAARRAGKVSARDKCATCTARRHAPGPGAPDSRGSRPPGRRGDGHGGDRRPSRARVYTSPGAMDARQDSAARGSQKHGSWILEVGDEAGIPPLRPVARVALACPGLLPPVWENVEHRGCTRTRTRGREAAGGGRRREGGGGSRTDLPVGETRQRSAPDSGCTVLPRAGACDCLTPAHLFSCRPVGRCGCPARRIRDSGKARRRGLPRAEGGAHEQREWSACGLAGPHRNGRGRGGPRGRLRADCGQKLRGRRSNRVAEAAEGGRPLAPCSTV